MSLFSKNNIDTEKELELIATLYDFMMETVEGEAGAESYGPKEAKKSLNRKIKTLEDLLKFDLKAYQDCVDKGLFVVARGVRDALRDMLYALIQEDKFVSEGGSDLYEAGYLRSNARSAHDKLQHSLGSFRIETLKSTDRYKTAHGGRYADKEIEKYSIRQTL